MNKFKIIYLDGKEEVLERVDLTLNFANVVVFRQYDEATRNWEANAIIIPLTAIRKILKV